MYQMVAAWISIEPATPRHEEAGVPSQGEDPERPLAPTVLRLMRHQTPAGR